MLFNKHLAHATLPHQTGFGLLRLKLTYNPSMEKDLAKKTPTSEQEPYYEEALNEMNTGERRPGIYAKALADSLGDEKKVDALYLEYRAQSLMEEAEKLAEVKFEKERLAEVKVETERLAEAEKERLAQAERIVEAELEEKRRAEAELKAEKIAEAERISEIQTQESKFSSAGFIGLMIPLITVLCFCFYVIYE